MIFLPLVGLGIVGGTLVVARAEGLQDELRRWYNGRAHNPSRAPIDAYSISWRLRGVG
jgi:hypothetical protein